MKNSLTNPIKYNKVIIPEAILLTVLFHAVFFVLFSVPSVKTKGIERENTTVTLLRYSNDNSTDNTHLKELFNYSPTHFSNPHSKIGFNSFRSPVKRKFSAPPSMQLNNADVISSKYGITNVPLPQVKTPGNILPYYRQESKTAAIQNMEYPFAVSSSGLTIPFTLSTDEQQIMREFPLSPGIYKLIYDRKNNIMPRLILLRSCGRRALDKLAIRIMYQEMKKLSQCANGEIFTVYYNSQDSTGENL